MSEADGRTPDPGRAMNGGQALVGVLEHLGVDTIFGLCGDTSLPWYEALADVAHHPPHPHPRRTQRRLHGRRVRAPERQGRGVRGPERRGCHLHPPRGRGSERVFGADGVPHLRHRHHRAGRGHPDRPRPGRPVRARDPAGVLPHHPPGPARHDARGLPGGLHRPPGRLPDRPPLRHPGRFGPRFRRSRRRLLRSLPRRAGRPRPRPGARRCPRARPQPAAP